MSRIMQEWPRRHRITVDHYYRMAEAGLFEDQARVELIEGEIVDMPPIGSRHAGKASRLADLLRDAVGGRAIVRTQWPARSSEPMPYNMRRIIDLEEDACEQADDS